MAGEQITLSKEGSIAGEQVVLYTSPASQICLECKSGLGVHYLDALVPEDSPAICFANCKDNNLGKCPKFAYRDDEEFMNHEKKDEEGEIANGN